MDPQEAPSKLEHSEPKQDKVEEEEPELEASSSPPEANTGEMEQGTQPTETSHNTPPLQNGTSDCWDYKDLCPVHWVVRLKHQIHAARCSRNKSHNYYHFPGELSEGADSPEAEENKSKDGEFLFFFCLEVLTKNKGAND